MSADTREASFVVFPWHPMNQMLKRKKCRVCKGKGRLQGGDDLAQWEVPCYHCFESGLEPIVEEKREA